MLINTFFASRLPFFAAPPPESTALPETSDFPEKHMTNVEIKPAIACTILTGMSRTSTSGLPPDLSLFGFLMQYTFPSASERGFM